MTRKRFGTVSKWRFGGVRGHEFARRVLRNIKKHEIIGRSAQLAYYFLLALFPFLLFLVSLIGLLLGSGTGLRAALVQYLDQLLPTTASQLVTDTLGDVAMASGTGKLSFGFLAALWAASSGIVAMSQALNAAYGVPETRPWWQQRLAAVGLTIILSILIILALALVLGGGAIADRLAAIYQLDGVFTLGWKIVQVPLILATMLLAFALIYYFAPDLKQHSWEWLTPGSLLSVVLWLVASFAFKLYLHFFNSYSKTYGSLGAVIILMLWLYLSGLAVLIGGEVNSEIGRAGTEDASRRKEGVKTPAW